MNRTMKNKKGFTLMEMLIVVAIIAVLVAIAIPVYQGQVHKAKVAADWANVRAYYAELQADYLTTGEYLDIKYMDEYGFDMTQIPAHGNSTNQNLLCFPLKNLVISGVSAYQILKPHVLSLVFSLTG